MITRRKISAFFILHSAFALAAAAQVFLSWSPPNNVTPQGYVIFHGSISGNYSDLWCAGAATNYTVPTLPDGANYFTVAALYLTNGVLQVSAWANEVIVTNSPALILTSIILTSTNAGAAHAGWRPWATNNFIIQPSAAQFFRNGALTIARTNLITTH